MRLNAQTATIENGFVHLPAEADWLADVRGQSRKSFCRSHTGN
jgi:hypothetical protein